MDEKNFIEIVTNYVQSLSASDESVRPIRGTALLSQTSAPIIGIGGITSMCLSIAAMIIVFLMFLFAGYISLQHNHRPPPSQLTLVSLGVLGGTGMAFVGGLLGFIALLSPTQTNGFAAVGLALGIMVVLGVITLIVIGMAFAPVVR